jgi:predicted glycoside hydrolase/deacetylase ChbG (UPF0249 family)
MTRRLIVNSDDFGLSPGINEGLMYAHQQGVVTSASLMVRQPGAQQAATYARSNPGLSVGIHLDLAEWVYADESWQLLYRWVDVDDADAVAREVERQITRFIALVGKQPTHVDSHQHIHRSEPAGTIITEAARWLDVPLRNQSGVRYHGNFYGQGNKGEAMPELISCDTLLTALEQLPEGTTELACHAGFAEDTTSVYRVERRLETCVLSDARVKDSIRDLDIELISFADVSA